MATPAPAEPRPATTAYKSLRMPAKGVNGHSKLVVPRLKLGLVTTSDAEAQLSPASPAAIPAVKQSQKVEQKTAAVARKARSTSPQSSAMHPVSPRARAKAPSKPATTTKQPTSRLPPHTPSMRREVAAAKGSIHGQSKGSIAQKYPQKQSLSLSSPDLSPRGQLSSEDVDPAADSDVPLACQTAICKRR